MTARPQPCGVRCHLEFLKMLLPMSPPETGVGKGAGKRSIRDKFSKKPKDINKLNSILLVPPDLSLALAQSHPVSNIYITITQMRIRISIATNSEKRYGTYSNNNVSFGGTWRGRPGSGLQKRMHRSAWHNPFDPDGLFRLKTRFRVWSLGFGG